MADRHVHICGSRIAEGIGVHKVDISGLTPAADGKVVIEARDNSNNVESYHAYRVPHIFTADATLSEQPGDYSSILWVKSGTLTINTDIVLAAIYVDSEAKLVINTGKTLTSGICNSGDQSSAHPLMYSGVPRSSAPPIWPGATAIIELSPTKMDLVP